MVELRRSALICVLALTAGGCSLPIIGAPSREPAPTPRSNAGGEAQPTARPESKPGLWLGTRPRALPTSADRCYAQLAQAGVAFDALPVEAARGVAMPARLRGPVGGITIAPRERSPVHEVLDCRLALRLLAWAPMLRAAGVRRLEHYSVFRPGARTPRKGRVSGHARGLAIDAARFLLEDGEVVDVLTDWEERERGAAPCPARAEESWPSRLLRSVVCGAVERHLFQVVLTPHHDAAHGNHVHLELKPEVGWTYVR